MFRIIDASLDKIVKRISVLEHQLDAINPLQVYGKISKAVGTVVNAHINNVKIGDICTIADESINLELMAEVIAIDESGTKLLPFGNIDRLSKKSIIKKVADDFKVKLGDFLLCKMVDGLGNVIGSLSDDAVADEKDSNIVYASVKADAPDPLSRPIIKQQFKTGVRSIDLFISCGVGQRLAIFAGAGVGKTTLMGMILRNSDADVVVVALIGERGREVQEFIDLEINETIRQKCVLIVTTSDKPVVEQVKAAYVAQTIAEYFRDQGKKVLLFMDSITRFARALREVGLSSGEAPARGGYPPSTFLAFPKLMERAGNNAKGSITAFYTVLMEGAEIKNDPIADEIKSIVDGHIILSPHLAQQSHFPAIDILSSLSRIADKVISDKQMRETRKIRTLLAKHVELEFLLRVGEYQAGNDPLADEAIKKYPSIMRLLQQQIRDKINFEQDLANLAKLSMES